MFVPIGAVPSSRPAIAAGRRAQGLSRLAALCGHPQGLALTAPSTVPRSCKLGRRRARLHALECALLVENRPCNAGKLVGQRDRQHIVVQSFFGGVDPGFEPVPVSVLDLDQHDPSRLHEQSPQIAIAAPRYRSQDRAVSGRDLLGHQSEPSAEVASVVNTARLPIAATIAL